MNHYFNTTNLHGKKLQGYIVRAVRQDDAVREFFRKNPRAEVTPNDLHRMIPSLMAAPLTSVRRSFSNLTDCGYLEKTDIQVTGPYGNPVHLWRKSQ